MHDRHLHLADDRQLVLDQQVVVAVDAAADRVLDRQHAIVRRSLLDRGKHVFEALAGNQLRVAAHQPRRRFAERSRFALICDLHAVQPATVSSYSQKGPSPFSG